MTRFIEQMKGVFATLLENDKPAAVMYGTVENAEPLKVRLSQKIVLEGKTLIRPKAVEYTLETELEAELKKKQLEVGDVLCLLRNRGGQSYVILGVMS